MYFLQDRCELTKLWKFTGLKLLIWWRKKPSLSELSNNLWTPWCKILKWYLTLLEFFPGIIWKDLNIIYHLKLFHNNQILQCVLPWFPAYYSYCAKWFFFEKVIVPFSCTICCGLTESGMHYLLSEMYPGLSRIWEISVLRIRLHLLEWSLGAREKVWVWSCCSSKFGGI